MMLTMYTEIVIGCWAVFLLYWIFSATKMKRTISNPTFGKGMLVRLLVGLVLIAGAHFLIPILPPYVFVQPPLISSWWGVAGIVLAVLGVAVAIWARTILGKNWGMPMSVKEKPELVTSGPYSFVRHPIYSGMMLGMLGTAMVVGLWWIVIFFIAMSYFVYSGIQEEKLMEKEFPEQYPAYKARTSALVPFIY